MARKNKQKRKKSQLKNPPFHFVKSILIIPIKLLQTIGNWLLLPLKKVAAYLLDNNKPSPKVSFTKFINLFKININLRSLALIVIKKRSHLPKHKVLFVAQETKQTNNDPLDNSKHIFTKKPEIKLNRPKISVPLVVQLRYSLTGALIATFCVLTPLTIIYIYRSLPNPKLLTKRDVPVTSKIFDRNGILLYEIFVDQNRTPIPLSQIPPIIKYATIAIEDKNFYHHNGFSIVGMIRAMRETLLHKKIQGGSTITQQLIKSTLLSPEQKISRKIKEIFLAFWAEQIYSKDQILEMYLNQVPYGGTAWGIESAAKTYFGKSVADLSLAEAALLAGLPAAPSEYSPLGEGYQKAIIRQQQVLKRMQEDGYINEVQLREASLEPLTFRSHAVPIIAPHFVFYVKNYLTQRFGERFVERGGLQIKTTLDSKLQEKVQTIVANNLRNLTRLKVSNGAVLVTNPKNGEIIAMVGSKDYFDKDIDGNVNITTSLRQPGSSIKVITYAEALEQKKFTAAALLKDFPVSFPIAGQPNYSPVNYDGRFHGLVPFRMALANSYNIPAVLVLQAVGVDAMIDRAKLMGIDSWEDRSRFGLSLTLGGGEVTMLDMAEAYGTLANNGVRQDTNPILEITDYLGNVIEEKQTPPPIQALRPSTAWIISNILMDNQARSQAFGLQSKLVIDNKSVSVKTGTTNEKRDNWTIGYTPSWVTTVWVGNNDNTPMDPLLTSGVTGAAPIWHDVMQELLADKPDEVAPKPDDIISVPCYGNRLEYFASGTEPKTGSCGIIPTLSPTTKP